MRNKKLKYNVHNLFRYDNHLLRRLAVEALADGPHLGAQHILGAGELLERPPGELGDHVVAAGRVALQGAVAPVRDLVQGQAGGQQRRHHRDGEPRRLGRQRGTPRGARVDLDDAELAVGLADEIEADEAGEPVLEGASA